MSERLTSTEREALIRDELAGDPAFDDSASLALLVSALANPSVWARPRAGLEDAVVRAVLGADRTAPSDVVPMRPRPEAPRRIQAPRRIRAPRRRRVLLSAAAAIAALATLGGAHLARREAKPDFKAELTATAVAPAAGAVAEGYKTDAGFRVELHAGGLPTLATQEYFQAWLRNSAGTAVPVGTFSSSGNRIILWSGVSPREFPAFSVTIETVGRNHGLGARRVLAGLMRSV